MQKFKVLLVIHCYAFYSSGQACISKKIYASLEISLSLFKNSAVASKSLVVWAHHSITLSVLWWTSEFERLHQYGEHSSQVYEMHASVLSLSVANALTFVIPNLFSGIAFTCFSVIHSLANLLPYSFILMMRWG